MFFKESSACFGNSDTLLCSSFQTPWCSNISKCETEIVARKNGWKLCLKCRAIYGPPEACPAFPHVQWKSCLKLVTQTSGHIAGAANWHTEAPLVWPGDKEDATHTVCLLLWMLGGAFLSFWYLKVVFFRFCDPLFANKAIRQVQDKFSPQSGFIKMPNSLKARTHTLVKIVTLKTKQKNKQKIEKMNLFRDTRVQGCCVGFPLFLFSLSETSISIKTWFIWPKWEPRCSLQILLSIFYQKYFRFTRTKV